MDRVVVFLDYQNVFGVARHFFHRTPHGVADGQVDPLALGDLVVGRRLRPSALTQVRVYRGLPDGEREPVAFSANERQADRWVRDPRVVPIRRPLRYPSNWPAEPAREKGVDVALAIDYVRLAVQSEYDVGILMSTDTDLVPALEAIHDMRLGARAEVAAWYGSGVANRRLTTGNQLPWCHHLRKADYALVHDPTDYRKTA